MAGMGNVIADNGGFGVELSGATTGDAVLENAIYANGEAGIGLTDGAQPGTAAVLV